MMRHVHRDQATGKILGHYANKQSFTTDVLDGNHQEIIEFKESRHKAGAAKQKEYEDSIAAERQSYLESIARLEARVARLETEIKQAARNNP